MAFLREHVKHMLVLLVSCSLSTQLLAQPHPMQRQIEDGLGHEYVSLFQLYTYLHANPELSFKEVNTASRIQTEMRNAGFEVSGNVGGNGVVGVLKNGAGPVVMIRTDLDGLPVTEQTGLDYASKVKTQDDHGNEVGVMHACGHDVHMTCFIGTARLLGQFKNQWKGTLVMIGQPAEERGGGAKAMLAEGLFERFPPPDYVLALHDDSNLEAGKVGIVEGNALAGVDSVDLVIRGISGHGAYPSATKDPIVLAAQTVLALQTIVSREMRAIDPAVVTVGSIHGGTKHNIIPGEVRLQLTVRHYSDEVRDKILGSIARISKGLALASGIPGDLEPTMTVSESIPPTINNPELSQRARKAIASILGANNVVRSDPVMGGEDFGFYGRTAKKVPICIFWLGAVDRAKIEASHRKGSKPLPSLHSSIFAPIPEPTIKTGVKAMTAAALELFARP